MLAAIAVAYAIRVAGVLGNARLIASAPISGILGILIILAYVLVAIFADVIAPFGEREVIEGAQPFEPWGDVYWLGTDGLGRDMASRLIYATRNTVGIAFLTTALAFVAGAVPGLIAAVTGGWIDNLFSRTVDVLMAIPPLIFALLFLTILDKSLINLVIVIAIIEATRVYRLARAVAGGVVVMDYIEAARLRGEGLPRLIGVEILPNCLAPLLAEFGLRFCFVILLISALSFLGLGIQPPTADWGAMVRDTATLITFGDVTPLLPAAAIALLTVAVNFVVDWALSRTSGLKD
ncbi:MAG: ABC transporter permease [Pseudomonadota bacterium]